MQAELSSLAVAPKVKIPAPAAPLQSTITMVSEQLHALAAADPAAAAAPAPLEVPALRLAACVAARVGREHARLGQVGSHLYCIYIVLKEWFFIFSILGIPRGFAILRRPNLVRRLTAAWPWPDGTCIWAGAVWVSAEPACCSTFRPGHAGSPS